MYSIMIMVLLIVIAGWFDARLNWQQATSSQSEEASL